MSDIGTRLQALFEEIAPPVNINEVVQTERPVKKPVPGWMVAWGAALVVALLGVGWFWVIGPGSSSPAATDVTVSESSLPVTTATAAPSTMVENTTTTMLDSFQPQVLSPVRIECSSEPYPDFPCSALVDADETTRWNAANGGIGAEIRMFFDPPVEIVSIDLFNAGPDEVFARNARIRGLEILVDDLGGSVSVDLDDVYGQSVTVGSLRTTVMTMRVTSAYPAQSFEDKEPFQELALAEIQVMGRPVGEEGSPPSGDAAAPAIDGNAAIPAFMREWIDHALDPLLGLPACDGGADQLSEFIAAEFPETAAAGFEIVDPEGVGEVAAMPRVGPVSLFGPERLDGGCLIGGMQGAVAGWALYDAAGAVIAISATSTAQYESVPEGVIGDYYHQSRIASGHGFNASVDPEARLWGLIDGRYTVLEAPGLFDQLEEDVHVSGERLAASLSKRPFQIARLTDDLLALPTELPAGYGPCLSPLFFIGEIEPYDSLSPSGEVGLTGFCNSTGDYLLVRFTADGTGSTTPAQADEITVGPTTGHTWTEGDQRFVAVSFPETNSTPSMWIAGPTALTGAQLVDVLASAPLLQPGVVQPRYGDGDYRDLLDGRWLGQIVFEATGQIVDVTIEVEPVETWVELDSHLEAHLIAFPLVRDEPVALAIAVRATGAEAIGPVDVLVRHDDDSLQTVFTCGLVVFNTIYKPAVGRADAVGWAYQGDRYQTALDFTGALVDAIGCSSDR